MAASKPTAVHFSLVFFVMTTLILGLVWYLTYKEYSTKFAEAETATQEAGQNQTALNNALDDIQTIREKLGYPFEEIGVGDEGEQNTVVRALVNDLVTYAPEHVQPSAQDPQVAATLQSMGQALANSYSQIQALQAANADVENRLTQETTTHTNRADQLQAEQESSEAQLTALVSERDEKLSEKDREIEKWRSQHREEQVAKEQLRDELERVRRDLSNEITELENVVDFLRDQVNKLENVSFEIPDGHIVRVDNTTGSVWIDLGSYHNLRPQVSFSVYVKAHHGVGRGVEDMKAKIEVVQIRDSQLAEARILEEDIERPIQEGDPIYSPIWTAGVEEKFSFVGILDLNGDGESDRELLHDIIKNAGAGIEIMVNDEGKRVDEAGNILTEDSKLTVDTKFLVVGRIPNPLDFAGFDEKQKHALDVQEQHQLLEKEARRQGIRTVNFGDFLNYIGYKAQQRLYVAGEKRPFTLKYGARSASTDEALGANRLSTGQTSRLFNKSRKSGQDQSTGTTSGLFRNN